MVETSYLIIGKMDCNDNENQQSIVEDALIICFEFHHNSISYSKTEWNIAQMDF